MKPRFLHARYFIWMIVPLATYLIFQIFGAPHFIWGYDWRDNGTFDPYATRHYTRCTYLGPYGGFTEFPRNGKCRWIKFYQRNLKSG